MKKFELSIIVILMAIPFILFRTEDFTVFVYWVTVTLGYLIYIMFSTKRWANE
ncbi:MAG: hypothetical protein GYA60_07345 [Candidatus Methanofastidiosa archaeon]|nr:hypothetical protein [Candidatus Methanofastidiosa archaeon]